MMRHSHPRVLHLFNTLGQGGMERQTLQLLQLLRSTGRYEVHAAVQSPGGILTGEAARITGRDVPAFPLTRLYDPNAVTQLSRFVAHLRRLSIDVLHTHDFYTTTFGMTAALLARTPVRVASRRELDVFDPRQRRVEHWAYRRADVVVANCERLRRELIHEGLTPDRTVTIRNAVDPERVRPASSSPAIPLRDRLGVPADRRLITTVANLYNRKKDFETLLGAAAVVCSEFSDATFVIAGDGTAIDKERLAARAKAIGIAGQLVIAGRCDHIAELLAISRVGVLSSRSEGLSNAVLEYMAAGLPVVATGVGGVVEAVIDGETGILVAPGDAEALAAAISGLLRQPELAARMGRAGQRRAHEHFSPQTLLTRTVQLYDRLLAQLGIEAGPGARV